MPTLTPNYALALYNGGSDQSETFQAYRLAIAGETAASNMYIIDTALGAHDVSITALEARYNIVSVTGIFVSPNIFTVTEPDIASYEEGQIISLRLNVDSSGAVAININTFGNRDVKKVDSSGSYVSLSGSDFRYNREYICRYDGTRYVWLNATSADQINAEGASGNFVMINADNELEDSTVAPADFTLKASTDVSANAWVLNENDMSSDDDTKVATQQSVKAFVEDAIVTLSAIQVYAAGTTWNKPAGLHHIVVEVVGGGGGGGGVNSASAQTAASMGGGGGEWGQKFILASALGSSETVTVGAGGDGGAVGNNNGSNGVTSSFGSHITAAGGSLGNGQPASATVPRNGGAVGGAGGTGGTGGDFYVSGLPAIIGACWSATAVIASYSGSSRLSGSVNIQGAGIGSDGDGSDGDGYGGGGGGAKTTGGTTDRAGGAGADGVVIVYEYV